MARRKRSKQPNLPEATLERAREQANLISADETGADETDETTSETGTPQPDAAAPVKLAPKAPISQRTGRRISTARLEQSRRRGDIDGEMVEYMLENPTKVVTEAQLREEYGHVLVDLRNMALLAAALIVVMIVIAQVI
jgi:hypothetical protein